MKADSKGSSMSGTISEDEEFLGEEKQHPEPKECIFRWGANTEAAHSFYPIH